MLDACLETEVVQVVCALSITRDAQSQQLMLQVYSQCSATSCSLNLYAMHVQMQSQHCTASAAIFRAET